MRRLKIKFISLVVLFLASLSFARAPEEAEFKAGSTLGGDIADWIANQEARPKSVGVFYVHTNYPLDQDFSNIIETEIMKGLSDKGITKVTSCSECRTPQINVSDDRVVISKGAPDIEHIKNLGKRYPVESFLIVEIYRTKLNLIAQTSLYKNPSGELISAERFSVPALSLQDSSVQFLITLGSGKMFGGTSTATAGQSTFSNGFGIALLEEVGFAKAGLSMNATFGDGTIIAICPTLAFSGRVGHSFLSYSLNPGLGYAFGGGGKGFAGRFSLEFFLGSFAVLGFDTLYFSPDKDDPTINKGYAGAHIGIAIGH